MERVVSSRALPKTIEPNHPVAGIGRKPHPLDAHAPDAEVVCAQRSRDRTTSLFEIASLHNAAGLELNMPMLDESHITEHPSRSGGVRTGRRHLREANALLARESLP
jgi:hypothetical protein